jgi:hypothetical protein
MKHIHYIFYALCFFASCTSAEVNNIVVPTDEFVPYKSVYDDIPYTILDYQNRNTSQAQAPIQGQGQARPQRIVLPEWLNAYLAGGIPAVEKLISYRSRYCFVSEYTSTSLDMIQRRASAFNPERDFPQAALLRVYTSGVKDLQISPDIVYGNLFEKLMKCLAATNWQSVKQEASMWIFISWETSSLGTADNEEGTSLKDCYKLFVLTSIDINEFKRQFDEVTLLVQSDKTDIRSQVLAFNNFIKTSIWVEF